ncbi:Outer membrane translocation and assembly module TamA [Gracilimonas mengyeensis]|uniref:Outer membrane translocation and assembly module TamA n=1 Tax=Gracilimonas mengyeensis TaxID=1302730 RepID=A0A521B133_9BACT|nr:Outer membrane translocation and assembly module TamA [Gracilimonas mengyeensis]
MLLFLPLLVYGQQSEDSFQVMQDGKVLSVPDSLITSLQEDTSAIQTMLLKWFASEGYLNADIELVDEQRAEVARGCRFSLEELSIKYSGIDSLQVIYPDEPYSDAYLEEIIQQKINDLVSQGYAFAKSTITHFNIKEAECELTVAIAFETGKRAVVSDIYFTGAQSNSRDYLRKISRFRPGQPITPLYLRLLRTNLMASELFRNVGEGQVLLRNGEPVLVFEVQERSLNQFDGLLGYVPDASGNGQIVGDVELSLWNVLAQGNGLNFRYQRLRPETSELDLGASQDWIGNIPIGVSAGFQLYQNDTTYQSREFVLDGYYRVSPVFRLTGGISFQATTSGSNVPLVVEPDGQKRIARLGFEYSSLDNPDVPTTGNRFVVSLGIANKDLQEDSTGSFTQNMLSAEAYNYFSIFENSVIATSLHGFFLEADKVTINDLMRFGGANSLRGYAEDQFRAGTMLWGDVEYRFLMNRSSYLFAFCAAGGYERPRLLTEETSDFETTDYLYSTGFGLSYQTRIGRLTFTYAISPEQSLANGKVHFGIRTEL